MVHVSDEKDSEKFKNVNEKFTFHMANTNGRFAAAISTFIRLIINQGVPFLPYLFKSNTFCYN